MAAYEGETSVSVNRWTASVKDRIPPHNDDAERAVIGAMLIDENAIGIVQQYLRPEDFYSPRHRKIFEVIISLFIKGTRSDLIILHGELERTGKLDEVGGIDYIASLNHAVPSSANTEYYAQIVQNCSLRRSLIQIAGDSGTRAYDETVEPKYILEETQQKLFLISDPNRVFRYQKTNSVTKSTVDHIIDLYETKPEFTGIPSGFADLDRNTSGFQPAELIIIGARPGMGKTAIALTMAANITIRQNKPAAVFSLEMSDQALMLRLLSSESHVDLKDIRTGFLKRSELDQIFYAAEHIHTAPLFIADTPHMTMLNIQSMARMLRLKEKVEIIFIDYIGLISSDNSFLKRYEFISEVSRSLKGLARELNIPIVALSQLRREAADEEKEPSLADIRESGSIEQDADVVMLMYKGKDKDKTFDDQDKRAGVKVVLKIAKNRNGPAGDVNLTFLKHFTKFTPYEGER